MQLEVYQTDAEAYEAAAALAAERLVAALAARGAASVAVAGGRCGRAWATALADRRELPRERVEWVVADDTARADDPDATVRLLQSALGTPHAVPSARLVAVPLDVPDPAAGFARLLEERFGTPPLLDVVCLGLHADGGIGALRADATAADTAVVVEAGSGRLGLGPAVLRAARAVVVTATGDRCAGALAAALREPPDARRRPAQRLPPSERVRWFVDRAAAALLLRDARAVTGGA